MSRLLWSQTYRTFCPSWWAHWLSPKTHLRELRWAWQRASRGWADCDAWSIYSYVDRIMLGAIRRMREDRIGCPAMCIEEGALLNEDGIPDEALKAGVQKWDGILQEIEEGYAAAVALDEYEIDFADKTAYADAQAKRDRGRALALEYWECLWD